MIIDTSALLCILLREAEASVMAERIQAERRPAMSPASLVEASIVLGPGHHEEIDTALEIADVELIAVDADQARAARAAYARFGKGSGSRARLNYGDCFSYALASVTGRPLLFKGDDFVHTDITPAL